ncbi:MAG TPA: hypothetical protein PKW80_15790 [Bacteroidales bacterium]|nr:hypothetical protein [Bacteroidales bacterium]
MENNNVKKIIVVNTTISQEEIKTCVWCGKSLEGYPAKSAFCSTSHRVMAYRARKKLKNQNEMNQNEIIQQETISPILPDLHTSTPNIENNQTDRLEGFLGAPVSGSEKPPLTQDTNVSCQPQIKEKDKAPKEKINTDESVPSNKSTKDAFTNDEKTFLEKIIKVTSDIEKLIDQFIKEGKTQIPRNKIHAVVPSYIGIDLNKPILLEKFELKYDLTKQNYLIIKI